MASIDEVVFHGRNPGFKQPLFRPSDTSSFWLPPEGKIVIRDEEDSSLLEKRYAKSIDELFNYLNNFGR
jgi:hypothetical protein